MSAPESAAARDVRLGLLCAFGAFAFWGLVLPVFLKLFKGVPAFEILAHRIAWGALIAGALVLASRGPAALRSSLDRRTVGCLVVSAALVSINWVVYIVAVLDDHIVQASLGYFLNPLVSVALGMIFLGERLRPLQTLACLVAAAGIAAPIAAAGGVPWIALILAFSFGFYGLVRKVVRIDALTGFFVEAAILTPVSIAYVSMLAVEGRSSFGMDRPGLSALLIVGGAVTATPLVLFAGAARRLPLTTLGLLQFTAPTASLLLGVFLYGEPFTWIEAATFGCIWAGCALYLLDAVLAPRRAAVADRAKAA